MTTATALEPAAEAQALRSEQVRLRDQLARSRRSLRRQMGLEFVLDTVAVAVVVGLVLIGLDAWLRLELGTRQILLAVSFVGLVAALVVRSLPRVRAVNLDDFGLAATLDRFRPGTGQEVADVLQLPAQLDGEKPSASPALIRLAVRRASESLAAANWRAHWNSGRTAVRIALLIGFLAIPLVFALVAPGVARLSGARWLLGSTERWPQGTYLAVMGLGDQTRLLAPRDEPFAVDVRADLPTLERRGDDWTIGGRGGPPLAIHAKPAAVIPTDVRLRERTAEGAVRDAVMNVIGDGRFRLELPPSAASSTFDLRGGDDWLGPIAVERVDRPALAAVEIRVHDPGAGTGEYRTIADTRQHLIFLPDTEIELTLRGTEPIRQTRVDVHPGAPPQLERVDAKTFIARWTLKEALTLEIQLTAEGTGLVSKPTFLSLGLLKDREPRVVLRTQGVGNHVTPVATIPVTIAATDDLGLASIRLNVERTTMSEEKAEPVTTKKVVPIPLATDGGRVVLDHQARQDVDLQGNPPPIGTTIRLIAEADDHCARGPQVGHSGAIQIQVVSPDDLFYEILIRQRAERAKFLAQFEAAEKWGKTLAGSPSAEDATSVARALHTSTRQLELIAGRISDSLGEMKLNQVGSPKSLRLLQDGVIDPILALNSGPASELRSSLQPIANGSKATDTADKARAAHRVVLTRMKLILDQMSQWESFVDVVNQVAEVIKIQQNVLKATEKARESRTEEVFDAKP